MPSTPPAPILPPAVRQQLLAANAAAQPQPAPLPGPGQGSAGGQMLPPELLALGMMPQQPQPQALPVAAPAPNPLDILEQKVDQLEGWAGEASRLIQQVDPSLSALLVPIAQAGLALRRELALKREQAEKGNVARGTALPSGPATEQVAQSPL